MGDVATLAITENLTGQKTPAAQADSARPAGLPDKFKTVDELVKSYSELEQKLGSPKTETNPSSTPSQAQSLELSKYQQEFQTSGKLSDESLAKLSKAGIDSATVATYIRGVQSSNPSKLVESVGGQEGFNEIAKWAATNIPEEEVKQFNSALAAGDFAATLALKELKSRYETANGVDPAVVVKGRANPASNAYRSMAEATAAMADPRYAKDPAYREDVYKRMERM